MWLEAREGKNIPYGADKTLYFGEAMQASLAKNDVVHSLKSASENSEYRPNNGHI